MGGVIERIVAEKGDLEATLAMLRRHPETNHLARELAEVMRTRFNMVVPEVPTLAETVGLSICDVTTMSQDWLVDLDIATGVGGFDRHTRHVRPKIFQIEANGAYVVAYGRTVMLLGSLWSEERESFSFEGFDHVERIDGDPTRLRVHVRGICAVLGCEQGTLAFERVIPLSPMAEVPEQDAKVE